MPVLDCLVVGYNDDTTFRFQQLTTSPMTSVEYRIFSRDHLRVDGQALTYIDAINHFRKSVAAANSVSPFYHVSEVLNLAAAYLHNFLRANDISSEFVGFFNAEQSRMNDILVKNRPSLVAITTTFYETTSPVQEIVKRVREANPTTRIVVGGPLIYNICALPAAVRDTHFAAMGADYYIIESQGELSLLKLLRALQGNGVIVDVPNLFIKSALGWILTRRELEDNPLREVIIDWSAVGQPELGKSVQTRTARSCAYSCAFCDYPIRAGRLSYTDAERRCRRGSSIGRVGSRKRHFRR